MKRILLLDTSLASDNKGDGIIMDSFKMNWLYSLAHGI